MQNSVGDMQIAQEEVPRLSRNFLHNNPPAWKTQPHPVPGGTGRTSSKQKLTMMGRGGAGGNRETQLVVEEKVRGGYAGMCGGGAFVYGCVCVSSYCFDPLVACQLSNRKERYVNSLLWSQDITSLPHLHLMGCDMDAGVIDRWARLPSHRTLSNLSFLLTQEVQEPLGAKYMHVHLHGTPSSGFFPTFQMGKVGKKGMVRGC